MRWLKSKRNQGAANTGAKHVEIWGHLEENNRFLRRVTAAAVVWSFLALAGGAYGMVVAFTRPLAFHVGADGQATFVGRLEEQVAPADVEVRYVAKEFLKHYAAFNSLTIESDLADAWNLMTEDLRTQQKKTLDDYERQHHQEFVAFVKAQGVQTVLEFKNDRIEISEHNGKAWSVHLVGTARTWPLNRIGEEAAYTQRDFETYLTLVRCPRTEQTPNGLLVAKVANRFFVADEGTTKNPAAEPRDKE